MLDRNDTGCRQRCFLCRWNTPRPCVYGEDNYEDGNFFALLKQDTRTARRDPSTLLFCQVNLQPAYSLIGLPPYCEGDGSAAAPLSFAVALVLALALDVSP